MDFEELVEAIRESDTETKYTLAQYMYQNKSSLSEPQLARGIYSYYSPEVNIFMELLRTEDIVILKLIEDRLFIYSLDGDFEELLHNFDRIDQHWIGNSFVYSANYEALLNNISEPIDVNTVMLLNEIPDIENIVTVEYGLITFDDKKSNLSRLFLNKIKNYYIEGVEYLSGCIRLTISNGLTYLYPFPDDLDLN